MKLFNVEVIDKRQPRKKKVRLTCFLVMAESAAQAEATLRKEVPSAFVYEDRVVINERDGNTARIYTWLIEPESIPA
jgi:hypothetical protein